MYNILFIMPDQLRADFLNCYGAEFISTPHIDSLCARGVRYERAISPSPICVPARASLLTGRNAIQNRVLDNRHWLAPNRLQMGISTWVDDLRNVGYHTEAIGKMHFYPWDHMEGFNHRVIAEDKRHIGLQDDYADYLAQHGLRKLHGNEHPNYFDDKGAIFSKIPLEHQVDRWVTRKTIEFIENRNNDQPFALMVGLPSPHCPYDPPREYGEQFSTQTMPPSIPATVDSDAFRADVIKANRFAWNGVDYSEFDETHKRKIRAHYSGLVKLVDDCVGDMIESLRRSGQYHNTIIIFASDHGDFLGDYELIGKRYFYEPSIRVPLIVSHPETDNPSVVKSVVSLTDIAATIRRFGGAKFESSRDSTPLPRGLDDQLPKREYVFGATENGYMVTSNHWKLCRYANEHTMLFDLSNDPQEQVNLAYDPSYTSTLKQLDGLLQKFVLESLKDSTCNLRVETHELNPQSEFSQRGWQRPFPAQCE